MQDSHRQIKKQQYLPKYWSIIIMILLTPLLLYTVTFILPTHDDWFGTTTPDFKSFFVKEHFFFYGYHWRPFDTWIGYIAGRNPKLLYPTFNHILVVVGHFLCTLCIFKLLKALRFNYTTRNIATLFFFLLPATMSTVTAIDSQNQVYALTVDIITFLIYIRQNKYKYFLWPILTFLAALFKENGLMWALICPILAFGFDYIGKKTLRKDIVIGIGIMVSYALAITILPKDIIIHPEYEPGVVKVIKNIIKFLFTSFITIDYIYLLHKPSRNLLYAVFTLILTLPFFYYIFIRHAKILINKQMICTLLCLVIAVGPHLLTIFSMMHTYAGLAFIVIIVAYSISQYKDSKTLICSFLLFMLSAVIIDIHLIDASIESGLVGKRMAQEAIQKTGNPVKKVYVIIIEDDYPRLSSFCVIPNEAFGWGHAARYETYYQWPKEIQDTTIASTEDAMTNARNISRKILNSRKADCTWIVSHQNIDVIKY